MSRIVVRPTTPADLDALANVLVQVHASDGYPVEGVESPRTWLEPIKSVAQWAAISDGGPVGHVAILEWGADEQAAHVVAAIAGIPHERVAVLARLFVSPDARGEGVASRLMDAAEARASADGLHLALEVLEKDAAAVDLYERRGWRRVKVVDHENDHGDKYPSLIMELAKKGQSG